MIVGLEIVYHHRLLERIITPVLGPGRNDTRGMVSIPRRDLGKLVDSRPLTLLPTKSERAAKKRKAEDDNAGPAWFNMPVAVRTPELENDVRLLSMRSALDPKQHYRRGEKLLKGKYFQVGTVISDPTSRYSDSLSRRQRGQTILDTLIKDTERQQYFKKKYNALQQANLRSSRTPRARRSNKK